MPGNKPVVALGLLTQRDLDALGDTFRRAYPIEEVPCMGALLSVIDDADRALRQTRAAAPCEPAAIDMAPSKMAVG